MNAADGEFLSRRDLGQRFADRFFERGRWSVVERFHQVLVSRGRLAERMKLKESRVGVRFCGPESAWEVSQLPLEHGQRGA